MFKLVDKRGAELHQGNLLRKDMPGVIVWGHRVFVMAAAKGARQSTTIYNEADGFFMGQGR